MRRVIVLSVIMLSVIMLSVIMLSVIMLSVIMLTIIMLTIILLSDILLSNTFEYEFAKSQSVDYHYAECHLAKLVLLIVIQLSAFMPF